MNPFEGKDVNYRAWMGKVESVPHGVDGIPDVFVAEGVIHDFYASRKWASECALGFNESSLEQITDNREGLWAVVFKRDEEPKKGQHVKLQSLAVLN